ncbi:MAG: YlbF family regulator [Anaerolineae bacterium]|nr:YlbF family regulator [Anaerolineae bacterium]
MTNHVHDHEHMALAVSEIAHPLVHAFAVALVETPQYQAFEEASATLSKDEAAQRALEAHQERQQTLGMMLMLNAVSDADRVELESLRQAVIAQPSVNAYIEAEQTLIELFQAIAEVVSERIGLPFAVSRSGGCCG